MSKRLMQTLAALACRRALDPLHVVAEQQKTISSVVLDRHLERIGNELGDYAHLLRVEYDTLRTANQRLELAAQVSAQDANDAERKCQRLEGEVALLRELSNQPLLGAKYRKRIDAKLAELQKQ